MHRSLLLIFIHRHPHCPADEPKEQSRNRRTPRKKVKEERGGDRAHDYQQWNDPAYQQQDQSQGEEEAGRCHGSLIQPARNEMLRLGLELWRGLFIA